MDTKNETLLKELGERVEDWLQIEQYATWKNALSTAINKFQEYRKMAEELPSLDFQVANSTFGEDKIKEYLRFLFVDNTFGSVGQGSLAVEDINKYRTEELYNLAVSMISVYKNTNSISVAYHETPSLISGKRELRAAKLRALSVISELKAISLFYDDHFKKLATFLGIKGVYPDSSEEIMRLTTSYLPPKYQSDPIVVYLFPWVIFEVLVLKDVTVTGLISTEPESKGAATKTPKSDKTKPTDKKETIIEEKGVPSIIANYHPENNHDGAEDALNIKPDYEALSKLIAYKHVPPPMAIGIFGNWGTGKSFFMSKMKNEINRLTDTGLSRYCTDVVHVEFNSWHYSDSNLWASLVDHIFEELHKYAKGENEKKDLSDILTKQLQSGQEVRERLEKEKEANSIEIKRLNAELGLIKKERLEKKEKLNLLSEEDILKAIIETPEVKKELDEIKKDFDGEIEEPLTHLRQQSALLKGHLTNIWNNWNKVKLWSKNGKWWMFFIPIACAGIFYLLNYLNVIENMTSWIVGILACGGTMIAKANAILAPISGEISTQLAKVENLKNRLEDRIESKLDEQFKNEQPIRDKVLALGVRETELAAAISTAAQKEKDAQTKLDNVANGKYLKDFIADRANQMTYKDQLGIISNIRKDFTKLDDIMKENRQATLNPGGSGKFQMDRIVLYIDDLDRCKEERVVDVLQAVHLLMALPLFTVVVGVDPRWVRESLSDIFKVQLGKGNKSITSIDYLEKIFQIPFVLKNMDSDGVRKLIDARLDNNGVDKSSAVNYSQKLTQTPNNQMNIQTEDGKQILSEGSEQKVYQNLKDEQEAFEAEKLELLEEEKVFMKAIAPIIGDTPRTVGRFVNVYQIVRAHDDMSGDDVDINDCKSVMLALAVVIANVELAFDLCEEFEKDETLTWKKIDNEMPSIFKPLNDNVKLMDEIFNLKLENTRHILPLATRFSFRSVMEGKDSLKKEVLTYA